MGLLSAIEVASFKKRPLADVPQAWELNTGINTLDRRDWTVTNMPKTTLKVKWFSRTIPQAYEL